jgi:hypothetical protein
LVVTTDDEGETGESLGVDLHVTQCLGDTGAIGIAPVPGEVAAQAMERRLRTIGHAFQRDPIRS